MILMEMAKALCAQIFFSNCNIQIPFQNSLSDFTLIFFPFPVSLRHLNSYVDRERQRFGNMLLVKLSFFSVYLSLSILLILLLTFPLFSILPDLIQSADPLLLLSILPCRCVHMSLCFVRVDFYEALTPARQECTFKPVMFDKAIMASLQFPSSFPLTSFFCPSLFAFFTEIQNPLLREAVSPWVFSRLSIEYEG